MRGYRGTAVAVVAIVGLLGFLGWYLHRSDGLPGKPPPPPGYQSPASAVAGFMDNLLRHRVEAACDYDLPGDQGPCQLAVGFMFVLGRNASGTWKVGNVVTVGNRAIVDVEIDACLGGECVTNTDPNSGLPGRGTSFSSAFARALKSSGNATDCERLGRRWYVDNASES